MRRLLVLPVLLTACVSPEPSFTSQLNNFIGLSSQGLTDSWGMPDNL